MIGTIEKINNDDLYVKLSIDPQKITNIINYYVLIQDTNHSFIGEITRIEDDHCYIKNLGEYKNNNFTYGIAKKPALSSKISLIDVNFISKIIGNETDENNSLYLGSSGYFDNVKIYANLNELFSSHLAIFGNTGSGKSCSFARVIQNLLAHNNISEKMNLVIFDAYGEYHNAFEYLNKTDNYAFKTYGTSDNCENNILIPPWLLNADDYALLLNIDNASQMPIIEKALRNVDLFVRPEEEVSKYKNSIIATALVDILLSGRPASQIRDQVTGILSKFYTKNLNLETIISQPGYNRTLRQCLLVDENGKMNAIELVTNFIKTFITDDISSSFPDGSYKYSLEDFRNALDFALVEEGIWKSERVYDNSNILMVRINSLINSEYGKVFQVNDYIDKEDYIRDLFIIKHNNRKAQVINFNISSFDDRMAKSIVKIYAKLLFNYAKETDRRGETPFNIFLEEAHRYVQNDTDIDIIGYNIFERISKEGRKYGVLLGLISQRPVELSETCLSQCSNYLLFKITHPNDLAFIEKSIPSITPEIISTVKTNLPGNCMAFGSAFKLPILVKIDMPDPRPSSESVNISSIWFN